ncbi:MAG: hypothetical protein IJU68_05405 [Bacteroidales bacterium]|nr:hypothetical protein [Bacteroidales bacterium]
MPQLDSLKMPDFSDFKFHNSPRKVVYVIDGEWHDEATAFNAISPLDIESITVLKDDSPEAKKYGDNVSVIQIQTKKGKKTTCLSHSKTFPA